MREMIEAEIGGRLYPLNFSVKASRLLIEKFGDLDKAFDGAEDGAVKTEEMAGYIDKISFMLEVLINQGVAKRSISFQLMTRAELLEYGRSHDIPGMDEGMTTDQMIAKIEQLKPLTADQIETLISFEDFNPLMEKVNQCMNVGAEREVTTKDPNEETTPEE